MSLSIRTKLFLTLLIAGTLAVVATHAFVYWSFRHGLMELAEARQRDRLGLIRERLTERFREDHSWKRLAEDRALWLAALAGHGDAPGPRHRFRHHLVPEAPNGGSGIQRYPRQDAPGVWPPSRVLRRARGAEGRPLPLEMRLMLLDATGEIVYGRQELLQNAVRFPLRLDGERIGELALVPGPLIHETGELRFKESQTSAFVAIALGMILLSALFAYPLSERLSRPILAFRDAARRLADGDFAARVPTDRRDELGRLGRDINTLAETLEQNEQARRRWVADISHELRTPLALLRAELEALQDGVRPIERTAVDSLHADVLRLSRLVDDLYELSMTDLGALAYRKTETDLAEVLQEGLNAYRAELAGAGLELALENRLGEPVVLQTDPHRLSQLFRNLLRNSLEYTDAGGGLTVTVGKELDELVIDFQDTAPGVPVQSLPHLFERLYRVEVSRSRNAGGAGLGLAICRNIVEAHGGTIQARPSPYGGLWIRIQLPIA